MQWEVPSRHPVEACEGAIYTSLKSWGEVQPETEVWEPLVSYRW